MIAATVTVVMLFLLLDGSGYLTEGRVGRQRRTVAELRYSAQALRTFRDRHGGFPRGNWSQVSSLLTTEGLLPGPVNSDVYGTPYDYRSFSVADSSGLPQQFRLRSAGPTRSSSQPRQPAR